MGGLRGQGLRHHPEESSRHLTWGLPGGARAVGDTGPPCSTQTSVLVVVQPVGGCARFMPLPSTLSTRQPSHTLCTGTLNSTCVAAQPQAFTRAGRSPFLSFPAPAGTQHSDCCPSSRTAPQHDPGPGSVRATAQPPVHMWRPQISLGPLHRHA